MVVFRNRRTSSTQKKICYSSPKGASISLTTSTLASVEASVSQLERKMKFTFLHVCLTMNQKHELYLVSGIRIYEVSFYCYVIVCIGENKTKLMTYYVNDSAIIESQRVRCNSGR